MINQGINVPDNTIAVFHDDVYGVFNKSRTKDIISKPSKKRDWFHPHFYKCLPLTIGNQYGFIITAEFDFGFEWNGGPLQEDVIIYLKEDVENKFPLVASHFGSGIVTLELPFSLRTPPGVNLMTINPPNYPIPNVTVMTGVVEADNLRKDFTLNLKIQAPSVQTFIEKGMPIAGILPIPRGFVEKFELVDAEDIFSEKVFLEEYQARIDAGTKRTEIELKTEERVGKDYFKGRDVYGNKFPDHQGPTI
jgi:hypothetical protein